jgi:hypothetical protein
MPLVSGVNIAGLALMGQKGTILDGKLPLTLDAQIRRDVTNVRFANFAGTVENRFWKI